MRKIILTINLILISILLVSCEYINELLPKHEVRFVYNNEVLDTVLVSNNGKIEETTLIDVDEGYYIEGWYKDLSDETSKWNFDIDKVNTNLILYANLLMKDNYLKVENIVLNDNILSWDNISNASYKVNDVIVSDSKIDLNSLNLKPLKETNINIKVLKENYNSIDEEVLITFYPNETIQTQEIDFEAFDFDDFKELNRSQFKSNLINLDDFYLNITEGRLTNKNEQPKDGLVSLILREEGSITLLEEINDFVKLTFDLGVYQNRENNKSKINVYAKNNVLNDYIFIKQFIPIDEGFTKVSIDKEDVLDKMDIEKLTFLIEIDKENHNLIIDNINILENLKSHYKIKYLNNENLELDEYYLSASNKKGKELVEELRFIVSSNLNPVSYKDIKEVIEFSDINPTNSSEVIGIYDQNYHKANWGKRSDWHREHVWPNSRLGMDRVKENEVNQGSDPHNLRAITPSTNSSRSNRYFSDKIDDKLTLGHTLKDGMYYPGDNDIGDVARILMYMVVRYDFLGLTDNVTLLSEKAYTMDAAYMGKLSVLLNWHEKDPVDDFERYRNDIIFNYQNNRNPFIDHPELFEEVFNYYVEIDNNRKISVDVNIIYIDNYSLRKREFNF